MENYFGHLEKNIHYVRKKNIKLFRFLRIARENVLALQKEYKQQISKSKLTKGVIVENDTLSESVTQKM